MLRLSLLAGLLGGCMATASGPGAVKSVTKVDMPARTGGTGVQVACASADFYVTFFTCKTVRVTAFSAAGTDAKTALSTVDPLLLKGAPVTVPSGNITVAKTSTGWSVAYQNGNPCVTVNVGADASFSVAQQGGNTVAEAGPLSWTSKWQGTQSLTQGPLEQGFFGAGMQYGFNFRNQSIKVKKQEPTNVPFFMAGGVAKGTPVMQYGVFTNTWQHGAYSFASPVTLTHGMDLANGTGVPAGAYYIDRFYMLGDFATVLDEYTYITGRPFMIPVYGLGMGDSNCYHNSRHDNDSRTALNIAETYNKKALPLGWQIFDDGYGCGIGNGPEGPGPNPKDNSGPLNLTMVTEISQGLLNMGVVAGLWSSTGLKNFSTEVKGGIRVGKTDVAWVGHNGTKYAYQSVQEVADGIESNSESRRFIYTCDAWAGTHHNAVMWTGDNSGKYVYEQMQMQYFVNAYMSGMAHVSGDVDGIFAGSPDTYVRDIQMKSMQTAFMTMSGWAHNPQRQPWADGLVAEGLVRAFLDLKVQLTPYQYTLSRKAHETGYPPMRAMALEFPTDAYVFENNTATISQFMSGPSLLVAPVLTAEAQRTVYFPSPATFYSFWDESSTYAGGSTTTVDAPLHVLPLFVKEGSIIPMYPQGILHAKDVDKTTTPLTLHVWLSEAGAASFELYEDDGVTRDHEQGKFLKTLITASRDASGMVTVTLGAAKGAAYTGAPATRSYVIVLHRFNGISGASKSYTSEMKGRATMGGKALPLYSCPDSMQWLSKGGAGFTAQSHLLTVQTGPLRTSVLTMLSLNTAF